MSIPTFKGFEKGRYQNHDESIATVVGAFNKDKTWIGATADQAAGIDALSEAVVKSWIIQETGGNDAASKAAWAVDPAQVNVPGDWSDYKLSLGLTKPTTVNTGDIDTNLKAGVGWLARKGFGTSGQPPKNREDGFFESWTKALQRYNGRTDDMDDGRPYCVHYAERIIARANDPDTYFPIELAPLLIAARALPVNSYGRRVEIECPNGYILRFNASTDPSVVKALLSTIESL